MNDEQMQKILNAPIADGETVYWQIVFGFNNDSDVVRKNMVEEIVRTILASSSTASVSDLMKLTNEPLIANPRERVSMTYEQFTELAHKAKTLTVLPDLIADNWPDKKYTLDEIVQRLGAIK